MTGKLSPGLWKLEELVDNEFQRDTVKVAKIWAEIGPEDTYPAKLYRGNLKVLVMSFNSYLYLQRNERDFIRKLRARGVDVERLEIRYFPYQVELEDTEKSVDALILDDVSHKIFSKLRTELEKIGIEDSEALKLASILSKWVAIRKLNEGRSCRYCGRPARDGICDTCARELENLKRKTVISYLTAEPHGDYDSFSQSILRRILNGELSASSDMLMDTLLGIDRESFERFRREFIAEIERKLLRLWTGKDRRGYCTILKHALDDLTLYIKLRQRVKEVDFKTLETQLKALQLKIRNPSKSFSKKY